jgi:hypothetical protein
VRIGPPPDANSGFGRSQRNWISVASVRPRRTCSAVTTFTLLSDVRMLVATLVCALGLAFLLNAGERTRHDVRWFAASALLFSVALGSCRLLGVEPQLGDSIAVPLWSFIALAGWAACKINVR